KLEPAQPLPPFLDVPGRPEAEDVHDRARARARGRPAGGQQIAFGARVALEHAVLVLVEDHLVRGLLLAADRLLAYAERFPRVAAPVAPAFAVLDPRIDGVHERVGGAPGQVRGAAHQHRGQAGYGGADGVARRRLEDHLTPDVREADLEMGVV